ncbi:urease subunit gamma [Capillimicrobium parvum]|uniref:Urease subunit gamma n=1 Tax=Capillimicrobium parvum TaxID=2884022 RepID=A0A9E6XV87_9ACTN|nr:urease subunit gamma [Capillimicrobium parvum]UGS34733.1 Urease subunit gamma 1 [Capillimicrobium parvum]
MQLTGRETERLLIFAAAELARRRMREGILLSHPDCVALASDVAMEAARAGRSYEEVQDSAAGIVGREQLLSGVAELLEQPLQVEATFGDGSRLVALRGLVRA